MFAGLFHAPSLHFPAKKCSPSQGDLLEFPGLLLPTDLLTDKIILKGTKYHRGHIVVTKVYSQDLLEVGEIHRIVVRHNDIHLIVSLYNAARNRFRFFESLPLNKVRLVSYTKLADYKPLVKRGNNLCFPFVLHHHLPSPQ